ncbi:MAG: HAD hydrolase family protein [Verrucomicrobiae bacterium]|nr:HAD hydrolase family protein [Verrucomicrobiae bacterium]MDW8308130.1 HAD hydrolase family protein [Verrucomicrobiales bacterium]
MSLPIQLISTDLDGTLYHEPSQPPMPPELLERIALLQSRGARWLINTGRDLPGVLDALQRAGARVLPDFLVLVEREIYVRRNGHFVGLTDWNAACARDHATLFARIANRLPELRERLSRRFRGRIYEDPWSPLCLIAESCAEADVAHEVLDAFCRAEPELVVVRNDVYARFSHAAYNKGTALAELRRRLRLPPEQVLAVGDQHNDLPMLSRAVAGWLAAPGNAIPTVQQAVLRQGGFVSRLPHGWGVLEALEWCLGGAAGVLSRVKN